jgi:magnesium chelatase family protein
MTRSFSTFTGGFAGVQAVVINVHAEARPGATLLNIRGLHDESASETRDRIRAAVVNSGMQWPDDAVTAEVNRELDWQVATGADLAIAVAVLGASDSASIPAGAMYVGELGLDGTVRPVRGIVAMVAAAANAGIREIVVPEGNLSELHTAFGMAVYGVSSLSEALAFRTSSRQLTPSGLDAQPRAIAHIAERLPSAAVCDALMVAAAGSHHTALTGAGQFQTIVAAALLSELLPDLDDTLATEVSSLYSLAGTSRPADEWFRPPLVALPQSSTIASIVGGGRRVVRPGSVSLAHCGVLYVSESEWLPPRVADALMACLDDRQVALARADGTVFLPTAFQLLLTHQAPTRKLVSLIDRCSIRASLSAEAHADPDGRNAGPQAFALLASRAAQARMAAGHRWAEYRISANAHVPPNLLTQRPWHLPLSAVRDLSALRDLGSLTARGYTQILQAAWTLADLGGKDQPGRDDVQLAIDLRSGGMS